MNWHCGTQHLDSCWLGHAQGRADASFQGCTPTNRALTMPGQLPWQPEYHILVWNPYPVNKSTLFCHMLVICLSYKHFFHIFGHLVISLSLIIYLS